MEINHLPPPAALAPQRAPSAVGDGDAGPNSPYYRQRKPKQRPSKNKSSENQTPQLDGTTSHIDIRV